MIPIAGQPIVTAAQMRAAEAAAIAAGTTVETLMARAGAGIAAVVARLAGDGEILVLCGPGNNGGDGYVAATLLAAAGHPVRIAASAPPRTAAAGAARAAWRGAVADPGSAAPAAVLVDALFGTGLSRSLDGGLAAAVRRLFAAARLRIAVDLPSGVGADDGAVPQGAGGYLGHRESFDLTLALGAPKPAHVLQPSSSACGTVRVLATGVAATELDRHSDTRVIAGPTLEPPGPDDHKYSRGLVAVVVGAMAGAARLSATAALRAGAGYAAIYGGSQTGGADAIVHRRYDRAALADRRIGATVIGPGLGRDDAARDRLAELIAVDAAPLVIDGDALHLLDLAMLAKRAHPVILTPHAGEFRAVFGDGPGSQIDRAQGAARRSGAVVVFKGATTVIAGADRAIVAPSGNNWLSTAGTGDVLTGAVAAMLARGDRDPLDATAAGVWLHGEAARRLDASFIADDLAYALTAVRAAL